MRKVYLLSGGPGVGKTSIIKEAVAKMNIEAGGFYTEEIREGGIRQGFRIVTLDGRQATLAHVDIPSPHRVSKYGVDIESLDRVGVSALREAINRSDLVVIDEIGKMELFSPAFRQVVLQALESEKRVLGTIMLAPHSWADEIKRHPGVALLPVSRENRHQVLGEVLQWLEVHGKGQGLGEDKP
jgi:nucleoside-triphosphatase